MGVCRVEDVDGVGDGDGENGPQAVSRPSFVHTVDQGKSSSCPIGLGKANPFPDPVIFNVDVDDGVIGAILHRECAESDEDTS